MDIYQEEIMEHYRHPQNHGTVEDADIEISERNSSCGDELTFSFKLEDGKIADIKFRGDGCAISQASASMLTEEIMGMPTADIMKMQKEDILKLLGIELGPARLKCALLSLQGVTKALSDQ